MSKRISLTALHKRISVRKEATEEARVAKRKRSAAKKSKVAVSEAVVPKPDFSGCGQTRERVLNSRQVQKWFREGITKRIRWSVTIPSNDEWWKGKQWSLAKKLLEAYEGELVKKAIFYLCDNWEEMVKGSDGRLTGLPTVEFLWSMRDRIFPDAERGKPYESPKRGSVRRRRRDPDEFVEQDDDDIVGLGW